MSSNLSLFLDTAEASFLLFPLSVFAIFFPEPCQKEWI